MIIPYLVELDRWRPAVKVAAAAKANDRQQGWLDTQDRFTTSERVGTREGSPGR